MSQPSPRRLHPEELDLPPVTHVTDERGLRGLLEDLAGQSDVAIDTEADSFYSYREKVCLVQITVEDRDYLVDPLAVNIGPLGKVLADPGKQKIFHDGEYDVSILKREYDFEFANLFDTRVAAATLGVKAPGLGAVLETSFGVVLDKSMQRSDWGKRPLSPKQVSYARMDTHFLLPLRDELDRRLRKAELAMVMESECRRLEALDPPDFAFDPDSWARIKGARELSPVERSALRELNIERDAIASETNAPLFRVVNNPSLIALAQARPKTVQRLAEVPGFSERQARRIGDRLIRALKRAQENGPIERLPRLPSKDGTDALDEAQVEFHERLKTWRKERAEEMGFDASLLINRHALVRLASAELERPEDVARIPGLAPWQIERYADELVALHARFMRDLSAGKVEVRRRRRRR